MKDRILNKGIVFELVSGHCNSKCVWCFLQHETGNQIEKGVMSLDNVKKFVRFNRNKGYKVIPFSHGEALIHPNFCEIINLLYENGFILRDIHTNLSMELEDCHFDCLSKFDNVTVNIGGTTKETHEANMKTSLSKISENVGRINNKNLNIKMVINANNINDTKDTLPDSMKRFSFRTYPVYFSSSDSNNEDKIKFIRNNFIGLDGKINYDVPCRDKVLINEDDIIKIESDKKEKRCREHSFVIRWNGNVQLCCRPRKQDGIVGNAFDDSIKDIMDSKIFKDSIPKVTNREYVSYCRYCS